MKFWDSSAIIPLCLNEQQTPVLKKIAQKDTEIVTWWATVVECFSAFARLRRDGILHKNGEIQARNLLTRLTQEWTELAPSNQIKENAARALLLHPLRAADSLQLAAALVWANQQGTNHDFVCLDVCLREAAHNEGFSVLPAENEFKKIK